MYGSDLSHALISESPQPLFMGEMPYSYEDVPARVVINASGMSPAHTPGRIVLSLPMIDVEEPALLPDRTAVDRFLDAAHAFAPHEPTYWHCQAGLNRSGLLVAAYLARHRGVPIADAIHQIRTRRSSMALSNALFDRTLRDWYSSGSAVATAAGGAEPAAHGAAVGVASAEAPSRFGGWRLLGFGRK